MFSDFMKAFIAASHNPCFSGQCFAILEELIEMEWVKIVTILVLVDSVLQLLVRIRCLPFMIVTILVLVDSVLQYKSQYGATYQSVSQSLF